MLSTCTQVYGFKTTLDDDPRMDTFHDVLYVPHGMEGQASGIYDRGRRLVTSAGCFHGLPSVHPGGAAFVSTIDPDSVSEVVEEPMIFAGHFSAHFGHFLTSTLSRYWWQIKTEREGRRLLVLNPGPIEAFFALPFVSVVLGALCLKASDYTAFDRPIRLASLTIPAASFEENNLAHRAFALLCNSIGDRLSGVPRVGLPPIYLSKARVASGVSRIVNEDEFAMHLAQRGIEIIYPETLPFVEQIALFRERPVVSSSMCSALHTGIFTPRNRLAVLNHSNIVWSNQLLFDGVNNNRTSYVHAGDLMENIGPDGNFGNNFLLRKPLEVAESFSLAVRALV